MKMNQPYCSGSDLDLALRGEKDETNHEVEAKGVCEPNCAVGLFDRSYNFKSSGCQGDCEGDPETTVGRERGSTESVANSHFPGVEKSIFHRLKWRKDSLRNLPHAG